MTDTYTWYSVEELIEEREELLEEAQQAWNWSAATIKKLNAQMLYNRPWWKVW